MASVMRVLGWKTEGLRCPDHEISCVSENDSTHAVTLVQMPNGTGKTTTLELLRTALSGSADNNQWDGERVRDFRKRSGTRNDGFFEVSLLFDGKRVTIRMVFDFENGRITYKTTRGVGQQEGFEPPREFRRFMNEDFVKLFIFDGELAERLLDRNELDAEMVVETLFHLNLFKELKKHVEGFWDDRTKNVNAKEEKGLKRRSNRVKKLRKRIQKLKKEKRIELQKKLDIEAELQEKEAMYRTAIMKEKRLARILQEAETKANNLREKKREGALDALETMRDPHAISTRFAESMLELKKSLDRVKLPESAAREFFEELANEDECVCGRPINSEVRRAIQSRADKYLGSNDVALLNSLKGTINDAVGNSTSEFEDTLKKKLAELHQRSRKEREALNDVENFRLEAEKSDPALRKAHEEIDRLKAALDVIESRLNVFDSNDESKPEDQTSGIQILEKYLSDAEHQLAEITETVKLKEKRNVLYRILDKAHRVARQEIMKEICLEANDRISTLIPYNDILIDRIDQRLVLKDQEGVSVGETLSVAWGFLATLFNRTDYELPFVVDSPAGPIDLAVRPKIGELIPRLTGQFIAFTISSEREQFISPLKQASNDMVQFTTVFRKGSDSLEAQARSSGTCEETVDGMKVSGETFFNSFQIDDEDVS